MEKYSGKLVTRVTYVNILSSSSTDIQAEFLSARGWKLLFSWFVIHSTKFCAQSNPLLQVFESGPDPEQPSGWEASQVDDAEFWPTATFWGAQQVSIYSQFVTNS